MTPNEKITFLDLLRSSSIRLDDPVFRSSSTCGSTRLPDTTLSLCYSTFFALFSFNASDVSGRFLPTVSSHPGVQVLHSCLLRCRCSALHRREVFVSYSYTLLFDEEFVVFSV